MNRDPAYWSEVERLFDATVDLEPPLRRALLGGVAPDVREEVESLLRAETASGDFIEPPESVPVHELISSAPAISSVLGAFRLAELIGVGGMGRVYRADRVDGGFEQQVAVKVIDVPVTNAVAARRFRAERQILASLRHPHVVSLLDGGVTADGYAYLVMEYVEGVPITTYCRDRSLTLASRLELFRFVCAAVHYAHRHGVIHRDIKPANIVVTGDAVPKVLDFGVAKLVDEPSSAGATIGALGPGPLTPDYASPEQLRGLPLTTSSDVYALGVLLYELLTGRRPYETGGKPLDEMMRLVVDADPVRPSAIPHTAGALPYSPSRTLKGDLDAIVLHAIAKDPQERYGSAEELADDLKRFELGTPVMAREPSFGYVLWKLALQHRVAFASAVVSLVLIVAALVVALWQARVAARERQRAEHRFAEVRQLANTLIFKIHDEVAPLAGSTPVRRTIVAEALGYLERLSAQSQGDPALQLELARAYNKIGRVQGLPGSANLGDRTGAIDSFRRSQALLAPLVAVADPAGEFVTQFIDSTRRISETLRAVTGGDAEAVREAQRALEVAEIYYRRHPDDVRARNQVASASFTTALAIGSAGPSLPYWNRAGTMYELLLAEDPDNLDNVRNVALVEKYIGSVLYGYNELEHSLEHHERALSLDERRLARDGANRLTQTDVAVDLGNVAHVRWTLGRPAEAVPLYEKSLDLRKALAMTDPQDISAQSRAAFVHDKLAHVHTDLDQRAQALDHARAAVAIYESSAALARSNPTGFGSLLLSRGRRAKARGLDAEACASFVKSFGIFSVLDHEQLVEGEVVDLSASVTPLAAACGDKRAQARVPANRN